MKCLAIITMLLSCLMVIEAQTRHVPNGLPFDKVIIWGYKLHSHTHSYIHNGFARALESMGYDVYWFDDQDYVKYFDFSRTLFITTGGIDQKIPLRTDCFYIAHNINEKKYKKLLDQGRCIIMQVYTHDCLHKNVYKIDECIYKDIGAKTVYMPWATDLLPEEIDSIKQFIPEQSQRGRYAYFIGTVSNNEVFGNYETIEAFGRGCQEYGMPFIVQDPCTCDLEKHIALVNKSFIAPALQGEWQIKQGYIPCRIFKNISYGQMGVTNSETVYKLFGKKIVYNPDPRQLAEDAYNRVTNMHPQELYALMDFVRDHHTYVQRIDVLLLFLSEIYGLAQAKVKSCQSIGRRSANTTDILNIIL